ncbi:hypothetical protein PsYK624_149970 [Phanerochaete sordida]|uniref:Uncharacterized protein n=1 Tax=Phanerochaete sordida TaxID=48140 RepID=A0A9P3GQ07_9APHY|nr:hypothetical protein PsYK624_149970 [Phanerochaete sordida]
MPRPTDIFVREGRQREKHDDKAYEYVAHSARMAPARGPTMPPAVHARTLGMRAARVDHCAPTPGAHVTIACQCIDSDAPRRPCALPSSALPPRICAGVNPWTSQISHRRSQMYAII